MKKIKNDSTSVLARIDTKLKEYLNPKYIEYIE